MSFSPSLADIRFGIFKRFVEQPSFVGLVSPSTCVHDWGAYRSFDARCSMGSSAAVSVTHLASVEEAAVVGRRKIWNLPEDITEDRRHWNGMYQKRPRCDLPYKCWDFCSTAIYCDELRIPTDTCSAIDTRPMGVACLRVAPFFSTFPLSLMALTFVQEFLDLFLSAISCMVPRLVNAAVSSSKKLLCWVVTWSLTVHGKILRRRKPNDIFQIWAIPLSTISSQSIKHLYCCFFYSISQKRKESWYYRISSRFRETSRSSVRGDFIIIISSSTSPHQLLHTTRARLFW